MILNDCASVLPGIYIITVNLLVVTAFTLVGLCQCGTDDGNCLLNDGLKLIQAEFSEFPIILKLNRTHPFVGDYYSTALVNFTEGSFRVQLGKEKVKSGVIVSPFADFEHIDFCKYSLRQMQCPPKVGFRGFFRVTLKRTKEYHF